MKTTLKILAAIAMMFPVAAHAQTKAQVEQYCEIMANSAEIYMDWRQTSVSLSEALEMHSTGSGGLPEQRVILLMAYELPAYHSAGGRSRAIARFRDRIHVNCLQANR